MKLKNFMSYNSQAKDDRIVRLPFSLPSSSLSVATSLRCQNKFFLQGRIVHTYILKGILTTAVLKFS